MYKKLEELIKNTKGNVLAICLDEKLIDEFDKNNNINLYSLTSNESSSIRLFNKKMKDKQKYKKNNKGKNINIKRLKKEINKNSADYIFCNMDEIINYYKYFIKDSIYMSNNKIFIYFSKSIDKDFILSKYNRYNVEIKETEYKNGYLLEINAVAAKNNFFRDKIYFIKDTIYNIAEFIGNLMIS